MNTQSEFTINWHVTEKCNYHCKFCFAKWNSRTEIWKDKNTVKNILSNIQFYCDKKNIKQKRLNIVGGEPLLQSKLLYDTIHIAQDLNFSISIITNGSQLETIFPVADLIAKIGISIDSFFHQTNLEIGREAKGKTISYDLLKNKINDVRKINPNVEFKINTVINKFNYAEHLLPSIKELGIQKWKILRQLPFKENPGISDFMFYTFIKNNIKENNLAEKEPKLFIEDNKVMTESYLMIAPNGHLFQNGNREYRYSSFLGETPFEKALSEINFLPEKFKERYKQNYTLETIRQMRQFFTPSTNLSKHSPRTL